MCSMGLRLTFVKCFIFFFLSPGVQQMQFDVFM